jgi:uncharacterized protein (DUF885 family)
MRRSAPGLTLVLGLLWWAQVCQAAQRAPLDTRAEVDAVADEFHAAVLAQRPESAYLAGVALEHHGGLTDRSPAAEHDWQAREDAWLARLTRIDPVDLLDTPQWITHGVLTEHLLAERGLRVCHLTWWYGVNHMESWHLTLADLAAEQPVETAQQRREALARWSQVPRLIRQETANLREGLDHGYSAARPVAERMLAQIDGLSTDDVTGHPYASPAERSQDAEFAAAYRSLLAGEIMAAPREYRTFLATTYVGSVCTGPNTRRFSGARGRPAAWSWIPASTRSAGRRSGRSSS